MKNNQNELEKFLKNKENRTNDRKTAELVTDTSKKKDLKHKVLQNISNVTED